MSDTATITFQTTPAFDKGLAALIHVAGLNAQTVVAKESGEVIKTLVRISPPKEPSKTRANIAEKVGGKFSRLGDQETDFNGLDKTTSKTGLKYYAANSKFLFAGAPDSDMRKANQSDLLQIYYRTQQVQKHPRVIVPFTSRRSKQRVAILTRVVTTKKQVSALVKKIQSHVGRLKAGWLVPVFNGVITLGGAYLPPAWVTRHRTNARGNYINNLGNATFPRFTIINTAKGVTGKASTFWMKSALGIRAKAMQQNALLFTRGKKKIADYAGGATFKI